MRESIWLPPRLDEPAERLSRELGISIPAAQVLVNRGVTSCEDAQHFLFGGMNDLHDPYLMPDMKKAVDRIEKALSAQENILIFGDYDVDGVLSVVILMRALEKMGGKVDFLVPNRIQDGYGLKPHFLEVIQEKKTSLVISVDCGIRAVDFVRLAREKNIDVIITDHHLPGPEIPSAEAVVDPALPDSSYPDRKLAGVGVVFKLVQALLQKRNLDHQFIHYLKLVSIGTIADIVELRGENRLFVKYGLDALRKPSNRGLISILEVCGLHQGKPVSAGDVGFRIGPRINAAGRMGDPALAVRLFSTLSANESAAIAQQLDRLNNQRQKIEQRNYAESLDLIQVRRLHEKYRMILLGSEKWHRGTIGIVASKLKKLFHQPVILFAYQDGRAYGSGRSIPGFPLIQCLEDNRSQFLSYGGHTHAVGCELEQKRMGELKTVLNDYTKRRLSKQDLKRKIQIDAGMDLDEINGSFMEEMQRLAPHGAGNPRPLFLSEKVKVISPPQVLKGRHTKLLVRKENRVYEALGWGREDWGEILSSGDEIDIVYSLQTSEYLGEEQVVLILEDLKPSS
ncbi:MAG: single-stranded-DNA-specific exonuclease RecJ [Candidatus Aminicenantes bacterium]